MNGVGGAPRAGVGEASRHSLWCCGDFSALSWLVIASAPWGCLAYNRLGVTAGRLYAARCCIVPVWGGAGVGRRRCTGCTGRLGLGSAGGGAEVTGQADHVVAAGDEAPPSPLTAHHHALWPETFGLRFGRIHGENGGHGELVDELAVDEQALDAASFDAETHPYVEADGPAVVRHHGELQPVQAMRGGPVPGAAQQGGADAAAGRAGEHAAHHVGGGPAAVVGAARLGTGPGGPGPAPSPGGGSGSAAGGGEGPGGGGARRGRPPAASTRCRGSTSVRGR